MQVLREYVSECDSDYNEERLFPPLFRASRGKQVALTVRFPNQGRQVEDLELWTHSNDTLGSLRRQVVQRLKVGSLWTARGFKLFSLNQIEAFNVLFWY